MSESPMIAVEGFFKSYPSRVGRRLFSREKPPRAHVLNGIDFTVARGEIMGLLGANGAGKTTLLHSLAALAYGDRGTLRIDGLDARAQAHAVRRKVGLSTVDGGFYARLTVRENLRFFATLAGVPGRTIATRVDDVLALVDLHERARSPYRTLSTGMKQRVTVARALLGDPPVLLLDEPTRAVDPVNTALLRRLIRRTLVDELGKTVVLATNQLDEAWEICDRVAILREGRIRAVEEPRALQQRAGADRRYRLVVETFDDALLAALRAVSGVSSVRAGTSGLEQRIDLALAPDPATFTAVLHAIAASGALVRDLTFEGADPADVFAALAVHA